MRIGELAELSGASTRSLRYYEEQGLLSTKRNSAGHRDYDENDVRLVQEIRDLLAIGFGLEEARPFVDCLRSGHDSGDACPASVEVYRSKLAEVERCIARLSSVRDHLRAQLSKVSSDLPTGTSTEKGWQPCQVPG